MQAFLWRHLVPAEELAAVVQGPLSQAPEAGRAPASKTETTPKAAPARPADDKPKFTKQQAGRLCQIKFLYEEWLITDEFNESVKVAECEAGAVSGG